MKVKVPVNYYFVVDSKEEAKVRVDEFLLASATELGRKFALIDYEIPYGYEIEEVSNY